MMPYRNFLLSCLSLVLCSAMLVAQESPGVYVIFDGSGSMWGALDDGTRKIAAARDVLNTFAKGDFEGKQLALRAYGHRREGDCDDSELVIPFSKPDSFAVQMADFLATVNPKGKTPITRSLQQALEDIGSREGEIILITDGIETCDRDPCELMRDWAEKGIAIRVHVVGFGVDERAKTALQCIATAAGTTYRDAGNADQLAAGLAEINRETSRPSVRLQGRDADGKPVPVEGILSRAGEEGRPVDSNSWHPFEEGNYDLLAGVRTRNGTLFQAVRRQVTVKGQGRTLLPVTVVLPPQVRALFTQAGLAQRGSLISVHQGEKQLFRFRPADTIYMEPGTYAFRAKPNDDNDLAITAEIVGGLNEIHFELAKTVKVVFKMLASGSGQHLRHNLELWQDNELRYKVHVHNGARVRPGIYELRMPHKLTPFNLEDQVITDQADQKYEIRVPVGHVTFVYQDQAGNREKDKRCFVGRGAEGKGHFQNAGRKIPLVPGTYNVTGWRGNYQRVVFEVVEGDDREIILRAQEQ